MHEGGGTLLKPGALRVMIRHLRSIAAAAAHYSSHQQRRSPWRGFLQRVRGAGWGFKLRHGRLNSESSFDLRGELRAKMTARQGTSSLRAMYPCVMMRSNRCLGLMTLTTRGS